MARAEDLAFKPATWSVVTSVNDNTSAVATRAAPGAALRLYITHATISASAAPSATVSATITDGGTTIERIEIPAAVFAPVIIPYPRGYKCGVNAAAVITLPAIGGTTRGTVSIHGFTASE